MRQRIKDKLRDRGGVTILMALFAMLVASMVCIVILGAAVTSVKQAKADQSQEQNTLALQSAGELILSEIQKTGKITFQETVPDGGSLSYGTSSFENNGSSLESELGLAAAAMLKTGQGSASFKVSASAQDPNTSETTYTQTVHASMFFKRGTDQSGANDSNSQLTITLDLHDPDTSTDVSTIIQTLYLRVGCNISATSTPVIENNVTTGTTYKTELTWGETRFYLAEDVSQNG